jgi:cellobiose-specific phosphotransferase system component IIB
MITFQRFLDANGKEDYDRLACLLGYSTNQLRVLPLPEVNRLVEELEVDLKVIEHMRSSLIMSTSVMIDGVEYSAVNDLTKVKMSAYMDINAVEDIAMKLSILLLADTDYTPEQVNELTEKIKQSSVTVIFPLYAFFLLSARQLVNATLSSLLEQIKWHRITLNRLEMYFIGSGAITRYFGGWLMKVFRSLIIYSIRQQRKFLHS